MTWWDGVVLGVIQGFTEFLPVSSSGHLVVAEQVLGVPPHGVVVEVTLHVATLVAVLIVYRARIWELLRGMSRQHESTVRALISRHNHVEATLSSMLDGVLAVDIDGRIISVNERT